MDNHLTGYIVIGNMKVTKRSDNPLLAGYYTGGGSLCLDFVNTVDWRTSDHPAEFLTGGAAVDAWLALAMDRSPLHLSDADVTGLRDLREALYRLIVGAPRSGDLAALNQALAGGGDRGRLTGGPTNYRWVPAEQPIGLAALKAELARDTADLLVDPDRLARVKECHGEGCGWLFVDDSRGGNRRWCSMQSCGNRAKARSHYRRTRASARDT
jgi:predicted RNA-binding Zn ribbon-like protein